MTSCGRSGARRRALLALGLAAGLSCAFVVAASPGGPGAPRQDGGAPVAPRQGGSAPATPRQDGGGSAARPGGIEAIRCWRRTGRNAVYVGERFDLLVTCSVAETAAARAVPDLAGLEPESLAVSPFEVLEGERYDDLVRGPRRFFQYRYTLRIIGEEYFGTDVELPPLDVRYRIERSLDGGPATAGRELTYVLPPEPVRVLALVPAAGADIRELPGETFGDAEARLFRANLAALGAALLGLVALATALAAGLGLYRARGGPATTGAPLPRWRVADGALAELAAVRQVTGRDGWSPEQVGRALAALRVAGAVALGRPLAQPAVEGGAATVNHDSHHHHGDDGAGQILVRRGGRRAAGTARVSSAVTPERLDRVLVELRSRAPRDAQPAEALRDVHLAEALRDARLAEAVRDALRLFGAVRYGRPAEHPTTSLTEHLERTAGALGDLARRTAPAWRRVGALRRAAETWERAWGR